VSGAGDGFDRRVPLTFVGRRGEKTEVTRDLAVERVMTAHIKAGYTVLVVDDDPSVLATYGRLLRRAGYTALTEDDPLKVLSDQANSRADLLLLDYRMPVMDGLSLLAELRRRACRARCILVSAFLNDDVRSRAAKLGVDHLLEKPVDAGRLREVIHELLPMTKNPLDPGRAKA
jgi:CheY-like chemotaxis protein